ncbi:MAG: RNA polymerase subunit sigma, partial [Christensenellaceae bacterium]|nr:RNA polymerase subunit sigma [Christensenellaceae bacterium]
MHQEHEIVAQVYAAKENTAAADALILRYMGVIRAQTAKFLKRIPQEGRDEELSVAMMAFHEAILGYERGRGSFLKYAQRAIQNRLIDHYRKEKKHAGHISLDMREGEDGDGDTRAERLTTGTDEAAAPTLRRAARQEILEFAGQMAALGIALG